MYDYRTQAEAEEKGIKPIPLIWVNTNKGDKNTPFVRSRICVRECKKSLESEQLFSAMPPLEALKLLCSLKVSLKTSCRGKPLRLAHFDISRAHFMPKARRELYVELPDEDPMKQKGCVGLLLRSMYGRQDASNLWQEDYTETFAQRGYMPGRSNPAVFHSHRGDFFSVLLPFSWNFYSSSAVSRLVLLHVYLTCCWHNWLQSLGAFSPLELLGQHCFLSCCVIHCALRVPWTRHVTPRFTPEPPPPPPGFGTKTFVFSE